MTGDICEGINWVDIWKNIQILIIKWQRIRKSYCWQSSKCVWSYKITQKSEISTTKIDKKLWWVLHDIKKTLVSTEKLEEKPRQKTCDNLNSRDESLNHFHIFSCCFFSTQVDLPPTFFFSQMLSWPRAKVSSLYRDNKSWPCQEGITNYNSISIPSPLLFHSTWFLIVFWPE